MRDILYPIRKLHGKIHETVLKWEKINFPIGSKYFIVGTPLHTNIGDSAIVIAEKKFINNCFKNEKHMKELTVGEYQENNHLVSKLLSRHSHFFGMGGGNMGDQWYNEELFRQRFITEQFSSNPIILPQTIYYSLTQEGKRKQEKSINIYNHHNLLIVARERKSFDIMRELYPKAKIVLTPDIVLSTTMRDYGVSYGKRQGVLFCTRNDIEKSVDNAVWKELEKILSESKILYQKTDMYSDCPITKENREECVRKKMQEFCESELVITDRLHGMIFAAITETPCIVFSNYNHKVKGTFDWISYLPYIKYVESVEQAKKVIPELLTIGTCKFDNKPLQPYFDKLMQIVSKRCTK